MATERQKKAVAKIVENRGNISTSKAMREAGYPDKTAKNPKNLTESKGYRELCEEMGLTHEFIIGALKSDITAKPGQRIKELTLGARILGMDSSAEIKGNTFNTVNLEVKAEEYESFVDKMNRMIIEGGNVGKG